MQTIVKKRLFLDFAVRLCLALLLLVCSTNIAHARYAHVVFDAYSGKVLDEKEQHAPRQPASLTKMMTAYLAFEAVRSGQVKWNTRLTVSKKAARQSPSKLGLNPGDTISVQDAVLALITRSANDMAVVLAESLAGNEAKFAAQMTAKAKKLGMTRTTFRNASGLPARGQITTARDMGVLGQALIRDFPSYYKMFATESFTFRGEEIRNHNHLLGNYPGLDGIKTGYIRASGFNLVASAERNCKRVIGVVMGGQSGPWRDRRMEALLDEGFEKLGVARSYAYGTRNSNITIKSDGEEDMPDSTSNQDFTATDDTQSASSAAPAATSSAVTTNMASASTPIPATQMTPIPTTQTTTATSAKSEMESNPADNSWGLQIGAYQSPKYATRIANKIRQSTNLGSAEIRVSDVARGSRRLYRARLVGLSKDEAVRACTTLRKQKIDCKVLSPDNVTS